MLPSSKLFTRTINTSESFTTDVMITCQRMNNDINGNPRYKTQVWIVREANNGNIWCPTIKGYRRTKDDSYILRGYHIIQAVDKFVEAFEESVKQ